MVVYHRAVRNGTSVLGIEAFEKTNDPKEPRRRVAYLPSNGVSGTCKCGGTIYDLMKGITDWSVCGKCGCDYSNLTVRTTR